MVGSEGFPRDIIKPVIEREQVLADIFALIAYPPNRGQVEGTPTIPRKLHPGPCSSVGMRRGTDRQTHRHTHTDGRDQYTCRVVYDSREM